MENFNNMNIYRFDILIRISESNHENSDMYTLHRKIESCLEDQIGTVESNILKQYIIRFFNQEIYRNIRAEIPIITNYQEQSGSLIVSFTLILLTSLMTYDTVRGAIDRILEDFNLDLNDKTKNKFNITSNISYNEELYSDNKVTKQNIKDNANLSSGNIGTYIDDCIKLIQFLNINNQKNTNTEHNKKYDIIKYVSILIASLITVFLIWNQFYNNNDTEKIKKIVQEEIEKYKDEEKINKLDSYYNYQQNFSMHQTVNKKSAKSDSLN